MKQHQVQESATTTANSTLSFKFPTTSNGYKIITQIGVSPHSIVYMANCNSETVAVKIIDININLNLDSLNTSLSLIDHPNILRPHCCFIGEDGRIWIVMPFIPTGPLQSILSQIFPRGMPDHFISILLNQLLRALVYLHELGFVHKAIKPSNIFFDSQGSVKLSVFDIMISKNSTNEIDHDSSIPYWVPPDEEYSFKSDAWAVGVLAMEITWGGPPIIDPRILESQFFNISRRFPYEPKAERSRDRRLFGDSVKEFVKFCLVKDQFGRPTALSLLEHPFVKKGENSNFLFKCIPKGVIEIDKIFEQEKERIIGLMKNDEKLKNKSEGDKIMKISGWDYNNFLFELEPDEESVGKRVRFGGEVSNLSGVGESSKKAGEKKKKKKKKKKNVDEGSLVKKLCSLLDNIDEQREMVLVLINHIGYLTEKQLEMSNEIKKLEADLASEKERYFQLELECEFLKLKVPDSEDENEYSDEEQQYYGDEDEQPDSQE
ncbi:serine/threonine-protein kinase BLUS1-like [Benincasa hispida]|uniref:serine/threonine-protein kinase BLUS1-like n=1 Tax=Benincasa hispida TaxID=102211 RepID=UPI001901062F|nr:serine/threonine-protein kinase BLUS1-like [Benincasa hispida]